MASETQVISISQTLEKLNAQLSALVARGDSLEVSDPATDLAAKQFKIECDSYEKAVDLLCDPEITELRERVSKAVVTKKALLDPVLRVKKDVIAKYRAWEEAERVAAAKEAEKLKKKGETVTVKPSIPTLAGAPSTRRFKVKVVSKEAFLLEWIKARKYRDKESQMRALILESYIQIDEAGIQAAARSEKGWNELKAMKLAGLEFYTE